MSCSCRNRVPTDPDPAVALRRQAFLAPPVAVSSVGPDATVTPRTPPPSRHAAIHRKSPAHPTPIHDSSPPPFAFLPMGLCSRPSRASLYPSAAPARYSPATTNQPPPLHDCPQRRQRRDHHNSHITFGLTPAPRPFPPPCPSIFSARSFGFDRSTTRIPMSLITRQMNILGSEGNLSISWFLTPRLPFHLRYAPQWFRPHSLPPPLSLHGRKIVVMPLLSARVLSSQFSICPRLHISRALSDRLEHICEAPHHIPSAPRDQQTSTTAPSSRLLFCERDALIRGFFSIRHSDALPHCSRLSS
ncbi:hypothetical protein B0H14DRAFT_3905030 [Mycena olivaceomarginata]|nr:hypothetical protein B0H14DRAFT_3905030 [Mycena olivaceomarginata]